MNIRNTFLVLLSLIWLTACSGLPGLTENKPEITSSDNTSCTAPAIYQAQGKSYSALKNATGYRANGYAVLYDDKQLGKSSPICETIDLEGFTAAHRTLPLPTFVKITNTSNKKSVVIKINDRGPANPSALVQVTPAVANLLGVNGGRIPVSIEVLSERNTRNPAEPINTKKTTVKPLPIPSKSTANIGDRYYIILGTFADQSQAFDKFVRVSSIGLPKATIESRKKGAALLHMVRLGPFYQQDEIDHIKDRLKNDGLVDFKVVKN
ncbi:MAG: Endolytic peptidoglycan transglycosylase RlpA [uncultured Thiotrichaceae bacterium]|uniref:Endolytic peptidoglycan transglycosylase RlpA n=1 Tax=uncultured Thiotrichaceae bacterium TaxID=298394 RepID=A0A6S6SU98_9GAMM|nr:MAG: Endolytic peptidoglycan transglycosylase RlpA [uncultured Thiotrichaceae bacterium]